ncbi:MAG: hypothetical protein ACKOWE_05710 [Micrococcales bacterium]
MRFSKISDERGSAAIDFIAFGLLGSTAILVANLMVTSAQHDQFIAQQAAKQIARNLTLGSGDAAQLTRLIQNTYQFSAGQLSYKIECTPACERPSEIAPGSVIEVTSNFRGATSIYRMRANR